MLKKWLAVLLALGLVLGLGLIGCSDDDDDDDDDPITPVAGVPTPTGPVTGSTFDEGDITFTWNAVDGAGEYNLQVADNNAFSSPVVDETLTGLTHTIAVDDLTEGGTYYWRVNADDGDYCATQVFTIAVDIVILQGTYIEDMLLENSKTYVLRGIVFFGNDNNSMTVTIEPGAKIYGESSTLGTFVVARGSQIMAEGTADAPIIMTSDKAEGSRARGDWGGLVINGWAQTNKGQGFGEGGTGWYGSETADQNNSSSGTLNYVRVEWAGQEISPENELNGIAFQGVGSGTTVDYVQVHMNTDDGIEFFGGTVGVKHAFTSGIGDDNFDWTDGWQGKGQFWVAEQYSDDGDQGFESDSNSEDNTATPRSLPTIYNVTLKGDPSRDIGMLLREGTGGKIYNAIIMDFGDEGVRLDHDATYTQSWDAANSTLNGTLIVDHSIIWNCGGGAWGDGSHVDTTVVPFLAEEFGTTLNANNHEMDPGLGANFVPSSPTTGATPSGAWFDASATYIGAFGSNDWLSGWVQTSQN